MPVGSVRSVLICRPQIPHELVSELDSQLCPSSGSTRLKLGTTQAYLVAANEPPPPHDYVQSGAFWTLALTTVVGLWFVSAHVGAILGFVRRG